MKNTQKHFKILFVIVILFFQVATVFAAASETKSAKFTVIPLGTKGGLLEKDLSSYLVSSANSTDFICLDAGTLMSGLINPIALESFKKLGITKEPKKDLAETVLQKHIQAYLISHAHLDHISGLVIVSPIDTAKTIAGLDVTIDYLRDHIFNGKIWANFANEGAKPQLNKYTYLRLKPVVSKVIPNTSVTVTSFLLNHGGGYPSTAFLLKNEDNYILYIGDTGADRIERATNLQNLWQFVAPLISKGKLSAIFLEASFPDEQPESQLFGHLTPKLLNEELEQLAKMVDSKKPMQSLQKVTIIVTHIKPENNTEDTIIKELNRDNKYHFKLLIPQQGELLKL